MELTENQKIEFSWALKDIKNGCRTLWVEKLKREYPKLYEYAMKKKAEE